jgi:uncharacterized integral membrane protein
MRGGAMANVVILLVIVAVVAVISVQNATPVVLTFLFWKVETYLSVVIFLSILAGIVMALIAALSGHLKRFMKNKNSKIPSER